MVHYLASIDALLYNLRHISAQGGHKPRDKLLLPTVEVVMLRRL